MNFRPGGEYLPHDWVDEGKLLLFMKTEVAERPPRTGRRLTAEKKRKQQQSKEANRTKRRTTGAGGTAEGEEAVEESDDDNEEPKSELQLMYNTVRGYVSAIMK